MPEYVSNQDLQALESNLSDLRKEMKDKQAYLNYHKSPSNQVIALNYPNNAAGSIDP
jgi:hypothetical protein